MIILEIFLGEILVNKLELIGGTGEDFCDDLLGFYKQFKERCAQDKDITKHYAGLVAFYIVNIEKVPPSLTVFVSVLSVFLSDKKLDTMFIVKEDNKVIKCIDFSWIRSCTNSKQLYC